jgi:hypothetical protein
VNDIYVDSAAAAELLGFGTGKRGANAIRQLVHRREIPYYKLGTVKHRLNAAEQSVSGTGREAGPQSAS